VYDLATENITPYGSSQSQSWKQTFTFDRYGNRRFDEANTTTPTSFTNQALTNPTISTSNNRLNSTGWDYDSSGNTTDDPNGREFVYDAENKQVKVTDGAEVIGEYWYDGDGKRVRKHVPSTGEVTVFVYDVTNDYLGSPRINTDANGVVTSRHDYHPFGEEIATSQRTTGLGYIEDTVRKQFTGYERDTETDLDFAQARMYVSRLGRFTASDPILSSGRPTSPQTWNRYVYVLNNPLVLVDPNGLYECTAGKEKCEKFEAGVKEAVKALKMYDPKSKEYKSVARALKAFWDIGKDKSKMGIKDGLKVVQGDDSKIRGMANTASSLSVQARGKTIINITLNSLTINVKSDAWDDGERLPGMIANEGSNAEDAREAARNNRENSDWDQEYSSLEADSLVMEKLHPDKPYDFRAGRVYDPSWKAVDRDANRDKGIRQILTADRKNGGYGLKPPKPKTR
jgi:RHS repeat-associated protein